jgi:hypothetical protein
LARDQQARDGLRTPDEMSAQREKLLQLVAELPEHAVPGHDAHATLSCLSPCGIRPSCGLLSAAREAGIMNRAQREAYIEWRISGLRRRELHVMGLERGESPPTSVSLGSDKWQVHIDMDSGLEKVAGGLQDMASGLENVARGLKSAASGLQDAASSLRAALPRSPVPLDSMSLLYGDYFDVAAPLAEVTTIYNGPDWPNAAPRSRRPAPAWALGEAEWRDDQIARGDWSSSSRAQESMPAGPYRRGKLDIIVCGTRRRVPMVSYRHYQALSFSDGTTTATVVSRHPLPDLPRFSWVADLEPYFAGYRQHSHERAERAGAIS